MDENHLLVVTGGSDVSQKPPAVDSPESAIRYLEDRVTHLQSLRAMCDLEIPDGSNTAAAQQQKSFRKMLMHVGVVMGTASAFFACGKIDEVAYNHFHGEALLAMAGKRVGFVDRGSP